MGNSRDIADSAATINYIDGLTSDAQTQIDTKAVYPTQTGNAGSYLTTDGTNASWGEVAASPSLDATASGGISIGDLVSVNSDGTVSLTQQSASSLTSASSPIDSSAGTNHYSMGYDSINDKYLLVYMGYLSRGYAAIGTLSGGSITWGTPIQVIDDITVIAQTEIAFDTVLGKFILFWGDGTNSNYLTTRTAEISGSSIILGTPVVVESQYTDIGDRGNAVYDPSSDRTIFFYATSSSFFVKIASISGTTFSFGSRKIIANAYGIFWKGVYVPATETVAAIYVDNNGRKLYGTNSRINAATKDWDPAPLTLLNDQYTGSSNVGDVVSHPTEPKIFCITTASNEKVLISAAVDDQAGIKLENKYVFGPLSETYSSGYQKLTYNKKFNSIIILKTGNTTANGFVEEVLEESERGFSQLSVTEITDERAGEPGQAILSDEDTGDTIIAYHNSSDYPVTAIYTSKISTSAEFIGISQATYTDGQTAKVQLVGSVDTNQTGLSVGKTHYVQRDGTLSTVPDNPRIIAGTAVSSTSIIVKG